jgi:hypothetical protein
MKITGIVAALIAVSNGKSPMSKTLTFLSDLDREFRSRAQMVLKEDQKEQFNSQMDHIVTMFHQHDSDKSVKCYNNKAQLKDGQLESTDSVLDYATALTTLIDGAFGDCENYIDIAGRAAELRWSLLEDPSNDY